MHYKSPIQGINGKVVASKKVYNSPLLSQLLHGYAGEKGMHRIFAAGKYILCRAVLQRSTG